MSIVIQNLIDQINLQIAGADSNTSATDLIRLSELEDRIAGSINQGAVQYRSFNQLPSNSDSAYGGQIAYVTDEQLDSSGRFYFRTKGGWINLNTVADLQEDSDITNFVFTEGGGGPTGPSLPFAQGETEAFVFGGVPYRNNIQKYSYTSDGNATDIADLTQPYGFVSSASDHLGGNAYILAGTPAAPAANYTQKFSYSSQGNSTGINVTNIVSTIYWGLGASDQVNCYRYAFYVPSHPSPFVNPGYSGGIEKFPISGEDAYSVVELTFPAPNGYTGGGQGVYSPTYCYNFGGLPYSNSIEKFPFASEDAITNVGSMTLALRGVAGATSDTHGYHHGGTPPPGVNTNTIGKWSLSSDGNATDVGDLTNTCRIHSGSSSTESGYRTGVYNTGNTIDKWSFSTDGNATDVGDLVFTGGAMGSGQH